MSVEPYIINPDDPRAPPQEVWDRLTPEERERIVQSLPSEFSVPELIAKLQQLKEEFEAYRVEEAQRREQAERRLAEEVRLHQEEAQRREQAERQLAEALAELDRLRR